MAEIYCWGKVLVHIATSSFCRFIINTGTENISKDQLPKVTLYTKDPCSLCDEVKLQIMPYLDRCDLEIVDISKTENVQYLRLYRYEIPVLFFNDEYLCKHRLDEVLLQERLNEIAIMKKM